MKTHSLLALAVLLLTACSSSSPREDTPSASSFTDAGLTLTENSATHASGTFEREGVTARFTLRREGDRRTFALTSATGEPLVDATYQAGVDTSVYFGGRARVSGVVDAEPVREGDASAVDELWARPEAQLVPAMKEAFVAAGVDQGLFEPSHATSSGIAVQGYQSGSWMHLLGSGDSFSFWSWSFWGTTTVVLANGGDSTSNGTWNDDKFLHGRVEADVQAGLAAAEHIDAYGAQTIQRQWGGALVTVTSRIPAVATLGGCQTVAVRDGQYCTSVNHRTTCRPVYRYVRVCGQPSYQQQQLVVQHY